MSEGKTQHVRIDLTKECIICPNNDIYTDTTNLAMDGTVFNMTIVSCKHAKVCSLIGNETIGEFLRKEFLKNGFI